MWKQTLKARGADVIRCLCALLSVLSAEEMNSHPRFSTWLTTEGGTVRVGGFSACMSFVLTHCLCRIYFAGVWIFFLSFLLVQFFSTSLSLFQWFVPNYNRCRFLPPWCCNAIGYINEGVICLQIQGSPGFISFPFHAMAYFKSFEFTGLAFKAQVDCFDTILAALAINRFVLTPGSSQLQLHLHWKASSLST